MSDTEAVDSTPWPVPEGSLATEELLLTLESLAYLSLELEPAAIALLDKRSDHDGLQAVWLHDVAHLIDATEAVIDKVKEIQQAAAVEFCRALPFPAPSSVAYADARPLIPRFPKNRIAWDNASLASDVRARIVAAMEPKVRGGLYGEGVDLFTKHAMLVVQEALAAMEKVVTLSGNNAKTTGLKKLGLDPDDYCTAEKQDPVVQVVKEGHR